MEESMAISAPTTREEALALKKNLLDGLKRVEQVLTLDEPSLAELSEVRVFLDDVKVLCSHPTLKGALQGEAAFEQMHLVAEVLWFVAWCGMHAEGWDRLLESSKAEERERGLAIVVSVDTKLAAIMERLHVLPFVSRMGLRVALIPAQHVLRKCLREYGG